VEDFRFSGTQIFPTFKPCFHHALIRLIEAYGRLGSIDILLSEGNLHISRSLRSEYMELMTANIEFTQTFNSSGWRA